MLCLSYSSVLLVWCSSHIFTFTYLSYPRFVYSTDCTLNPFPKFIAFIYTEYFRWQLTFQGKKLFYFITLFAIYFIFSLTWFPLLSRDFEIIWIGWKRFFHINHMLGHLSWYAYLKYFESNVVSKSSISIPLMSVSTSFYTRSAWNVLLCFINWRMRVRVYLIYTFIFECPIYNLIDYL